MAQPALISIEEARERTDRSAQRAAADLTNQRRKLEEAEDLRVVIRRLHQRNHVADDISKLIGGTRRA